MNGRPSSEQGFTLIELLLAVTILGIIMGPLCGAILITMGTSKATEERLSTSHDVQMASNYFGSDVKNSGSQLVDFSGQIRRPISTGAPPCQQMSTTTVNTVVVSFTWRDVAYDPANPVASDPSQLRDRWAWYYVARPKNAGGGADLTKLGTLRRGFCSRTEGVTTKYTDTTIERSLGPTAPALFCDGFQEIGGAHPCTGVDQPSVVAIRTTLRLDSSQPFFIQATRRVDS
jgi:prepilin-type N-terminal cleavage/methylation domain-containing protein